MESHYKDSLSTAIVNMLIQCGFENSSKRALDELVALGINYTRRLTEKIVDLTNECDLPESDLLLGLGALQIHDQSLEELFVFLQNYNDIFPKQPKVFYGPIQLPDEYDSMHRSDADESKPAEFVSWVPSLNNPLSTLGMKLENGEIITDPNFDRKKLSNYSHTLSPTQLNDQSMEQSTKEKIDTNNSHITNSTTNSSFNCDNSSLINGKYGSHCSFHLPPEAMPNKYETPTIDYDLSRSVIIVNGKNGKLPDPFISDMEEQDLMRRKSKFKDANESKLIFPGRQFFNGYNKTKNFIDLHGTPDNSGLNVHDNNNEQENVSVVNEDVKDSTLQSVKLSPPVLSEHDLNQKVVGSSKSLGTSDEAWNAALQATIEPIIKPESSYSHSYKASNHQHNYTHQQQHHNPFESPHPSHHIFTNNNSDNQSVTRLQNSSPINTQSSRKRSKKHRSSLSSSRAKKKRKLLPEKLQPSFEKYQNESTMDSHNSVPYSSASDKEGYSYLDEYRASAIVTKSPSLSPVNETHLVPQLNNITNENLTNTTTRNIYEATPSHISYTTESVSTNLTKTKSKKKSYRKTHFSTKRKKKSAPTTNRNSNIPITNNSKIINTNDSRSKVVEVGAIYNDFNDEDEEDEASFDHDHIHHNHFNKKHTIYNNLNSQHPYSKPIYSENEYISHDNNVYNDDESDSDQTEPMINSNPYINNPIICHSNISNYNRKIHNYHPDEFNKNHNGYSPTNSNNSNNFDEPSQLFTQKYSHFDHPNIVNTTITNTSDYYDAANLSHRPNHTNGSSVHSHQTHDTMISDDSMGGGGGGMRLKIKIKRSHTSTATAPPTGSNRSIHSICYDDEDDDEGMRREANYDDDDDEDRNSISERLQMMRQQSPAESNYRSVHSPSYHNAHNSQILNDHHSGNQSIKSNKRNNNCYSSPSIDRISASIGHSSPQTMPAYESIDDEADINCSRNKTCDNSNPNTSYTDVNQLMHVPLIFKASKSRINKKKKRSKSSANKKSKSQRKTTQNVPEEVVEPINSLPPKGIVSVSDVFSDDEEGTNGNGVGRQTFPVSSNVNHIPLNPFSDQIEYSQSHNNTPDISHSQKKSVHSTNTPSSTPQRLPLKICRTPLSTSSTVTNTKSSRTKGSTIKPKIINSIIPTNDNLSLTMSLPLKTIDPNSFTYCCRPGEANYKSADGTLIYICPVCNLEDNGSLMVCCDDCQDWYHGICLGITSIEEDVEWYCPRCVERKSQPVYNHNSKHSKHRSHMSSSSHSRKSSTAKSKSKSRKK